MTGNAQQLTINIDLDEIRGLIDTANRRVSAFVRFGLDELDGRDGGDLNLSASIVYSFWPDSTPTELRDSAREEFRAWLIGSCLRELDMFYGLFLDRIWRAIEAADLHGKNISPNHLFDERFSRDTNVSAKQKRVSAKLGMESHLVELNSLSLARNSLTHHAGVVRHKFDCNSQSQDVLHIKWLGYQMSAIRGGHEIVVEKSPLDTNLLPGEGPAELVLRLIAREQVVPAGQPIRLTNSQIAELCMFYKILCDQTIEAYGAYLERKGIASFKPPGTTA